METSVMLALDCANVVMERASDFHPATADWETKYRHIGSQPVKNSAGRHRI
jgi:creatinine amidohydrolase/Fe(II)-dependent formamide hydrolase-like protein